MINYHRYSPATPPLTDNETKYDHWVSWQGTGATCPCLNYRFGQQLGIQRIRDGGSEEGLPVLR